MSETSPPSAPPAPSVSPLPPASPVAPLFDTLKTYRGIIEVAVATVVGIVAALDNIKKILGGQPYVSVIALAVIATAVGMFVRDVLRRQKVQPINTTSFVGPQPLTRADRDRFYGREVDIAKIASKLSAPHIRHLVLLGESGCGKTSLLQAGVLPELDKRGEFYSVYLRFTDQPVRALRQALRSVAPAPVPAATSVAAATPVHTAPPVADTAPLASAAPIPTEAPVPTPASAEPPSLLEELQQARQRAGKPLLLFIDQFEEFHIHPLADKDYRAVQDLVWSVVGKEATLDAKLVFSLRYDFLHMLDVFYDEQHVDLGFASGEVRVRIEPFEEAVAEEVLRKTLAHKDGSLDWEPRLLQRVLDDLTVEKIIHGQKRRIVLPAELQIVCQMVQSKRITMAATYPGKKQLLLQHISEALDTAPGTGPAQVKQVLLALIDANGLTKAKPQTLSEIAGQLDMKERELPRLRAMLDFLDQQRRIVKSQASELDSKQVVYELAHDYLAGLIRIVAGAEMGGIRRSQAILQSARLQTEYNPGYLLALRDCWYLRRYPPAQMASEDRALVRRSVGGFVLRVATPIILLIGLFLGVRLGTATWTLQGREVVLRRGLPYLQPLLGSLKNEEVISLRTQYSGMASGLYKQLIEEVQNRSESPQRLLHLQTRQGAEDWLSEELAAAARARLIAKQTSYTDSPTVVDSEAVKLVIASGLDSAEVTSRYEQRLRDAFEFHRAKCQTAEQRERSACQNSGPILRLIAVELTELRASNPKLVADFQQRFRSARPADWEFVAALQILGAVNGLDEAVWKHLAQELSSDEPANVLLVIQAISSSYSISLCSKNLPIDSRAHAAALLWQRLQAPAVPPGDADAWIEALGSLCVPHAPFEQFLYAQAEGPDVEHAFKAIKLLLRLKAPPAKLVPLLVSIYQKGGQALAGMSTLPADESKILFTETYPRELRLSLRLVESIVFSDVIRQQPKELRDVLKEYLGIYMQRIHERYWYFSRTMELFSVCLQVGIPLSEVLVMAPMIHSSENRGYVARLLDKNLVDPSNSSSRFTFKDATARDEIARALRLDCEEREENDICIWGRIALGYHLTDDYSKRVIQRSMQEPDCLTKDSLPRTYAYHRLLDHTAGFAEAGQATESLDQALPRLLGLFDSDEAAQYSTHRSAIGQAIELVARKQQANNPEAPKALLQQLSARMNSPGIRLSTRLALAELIQDTRR